MAITWFYIYFLPLISPILLIILNLPSSFGEKNPTSLFIFGDSLYEAGNNNYFPTSVRSNHWPYGETYFHFPTGRASNGRLIPDFIAEYARLPLIPPYLQPGISYNYGVNFASLGAGALQEINKGSVIPLNTQLGYFKNVEKNLRHKLGGEEAKRFLSKAVYIFSIGTNDYNSKTIPIPFYSQKEYVGWVIGNLTNVIKGIYNKGGRKFGILNLVAKGWFPAARALRSAGSKGSCTDEFSTARKLHNTALSKVLVELERQLKGFKYSETDFYTAFGVSRKQRQHVVALVHTEDSEGVEEKTSMNYVIILMIICSLTLLIPLRRPTSNLQS